MRTVFSLSYSVAKRNKGFTAGLVLLFMVLTTIIMMERFTVSSVRATIDDYSEDYHVPDLWAVTEPLPVDAGKLLPAYPEIIGHEYSMVMNVRCRVRGNQVYVLNLVSMEEGGFRKYSLTDEKHTKSDMPEVMVSSSFAKANGINTGDIVELMIPEGYREFFVSAILSCPENMFCSRDATSWCDSADYGYLYLPRSEMDEYFPTAGYANLWSFCVSEDCTDSREEEILGKLTSAFGAHLLSAERFATSEMKTQLDAEMDQAKTILQFAPLLAYVLGMFFTCLFVQQVMQNQKKTIGLLRALGYANSQVLRIFILYIVLTCLAGMLLGTLLGTYLTRFCIGIYQERYALPYIHYSVDITGFVVFMFLPLLIGIASCIIRAKIITRMNPAEAYGGAAPSSCKEPPRWLQELQVSEMVKIALVSVNRNKQRFLLSALSISASIMISALSIGMIISNNAAQPAAFGNEDGVGGRFRYDALVSFTGEEDFLERLEATGGVASAEPLAVFMAEISAGSNTLQLQVNALGDNSTLIVPEDAEGTALQPGEGIILEEIAAKTLGVGTGDEVTVGNTPLKVTGIAREIVNSIQYITMETGSMLGYAEPNAVAVSFPSETEAEDGCAVLSELPGFNYSVIRDHQARSLKENCQAVDAGSYILAILAFVLGIVIVYNMIVLGIEEKKYDYATLIALGVSNKDFLRMAFTENILRYLAALLPGILAGCLVTSYALDLMSSINTSYPFLRVGFVCLVTGLISLAYLLSGALFALWKLKSMEPSAALNAGE